MKNYQKLNYREYRIMLSDGSITAVSRNAMIFFMLNSPL